MAASIRYVKGLIAAAMLWPLGGATQEPIAPSTTQATLARHQIDSMLVLAASRPCAATAWFYVQRALPTSGRLILEQIPTIEGVTALLDRGGGGQTSMMPMRVNPYSSAKLLVEVRWRRWEVTSGEVLFSTRAQLLDGDGAPLHPPHLIEPPTVIALSAGSLRVLDASQAL
jgi:hypothetical protein